MVEIVPFKLAGLRVLCHWSICSSQPRKIFDEVIHMTELLQEMIIATQKQMLRTVNWAMGNYSDLFDERLAQT